MAEEVEQDIDAVTDGADDDSVLDRETKKDHAHKLEIVDETGKEPTPSQSQSQGKTKTFNIPDAAIPSDDSEDETSPSKCSISCIRVCSKYLCSIQQFWPRFPCMCKAKRAATTGGCGST